VREYLKRTEIGLAVILLLSFPLSGHAISSETMPWVKVSLHFIHMVTVVWWFSGIIAIFIYTWKQTICLNKLNQLEQRISIFSKFALPLLLLSVVSGVISSIDKFNSFQELWESDYGVLLLIKIILTMLIIFIGGFHRKWWIPRMKEAKDNSAIRPLVLTVRIELFVALSLLMIAGMLAVTPHPG
jgi:putative copper export protein